MTADLRQRRMIETWLKDWFGRQGYGIFDGADHTGDAHVRDARVNLRALASDLAELFPPRGQEKAS